LLHLEEILQRKIAYANAAIGTGVVLPDQIADANVEVLLHDTRADIMDLFNENAVLLVEGGGSGALSGEEYRRRLGRALGHSDYLRSQVVDLPFGAGSGFVSSRVRQSGYVFCARIGEHDTPWFRYVAVDNDTWTPLHRKDPASGDMVPWIDADTLTCLIAADPGEENGETQVLSDAAASGVFAAWEVAQRHIHGKWSELTDWANLQPQIEKALRDAIAMVADHGAHLGELQGDLIARLNGRWERAIVRSVREIIRRDDLTNRDKADKLLEFVTETGLPIPEAAKALPPVRIDDIRVVCWMAVSPAAAHALVAPGGG
jgi:hypothetical protein